MTKSNDDIRCFWLFTCCWHR